MGLSFKKTFLITPDLEYKDQTASLEIIRTAGMNKSATSLCLPSSSIVEIADQDLAVEDELEKNMTSSIRMT